jgi:hypothetical protein
MTGVQLIGKKAVLSRFETLNADAWALYQGKQFIVGGIGADTLAEWIDCFDQTGSTATYLLRVYDSEEMPTSSTGSTDYLACISFKVTDAYEGYGIAGHSSKLLERIGALEKQLKDKEESDDDNTDLNSIIMGWLNDPVKLNQVAGAVRMMFGMGGLGTVNESLPVSAGVQTISGFTNPIATGDPVARIAAALDTLEKKDTKLVIHLEKLAALSQNEPALFQAVISKLDAL